MHWSLSLSRARARARIGMHHSRTHSDSLALPRRRRRRRRPPPSRLDARNAATRDRELIAPELCRYIKRSIQYNTSASDTSATRVVSMRDRAAARQRRDAAIVPDYAAAR